MEKNVVVLSVEEYNELRDFKKNITEGKNLVIRNEFSLRGGISTETSFFTSEESMAAMASENKELSKINDDLRKKVYVLEERIKDNAVRHTKMVSDMIYCMGYWSHRRWLRFKLMKSGLY